ncbi:MAG: N-acetylmuramoyl-L-alanine amidase [Desulfocapsaceae bacterium]|nr:N-acetylmuramoyl-L-alanine amidase [Desulfocapsaceae bacterium]
MIKIPIGFAGFIFLLAIVFGLTPFSCGPAQAAGTKPPLMTIVLDPGHNPKQPGALGNQGIYEIVYNDNLTAQLADALRAAGFAVLLTRSPSQNIGLEERARIANDFNADLFLAIHHDSAQPQYLEKITHNALPAYQDKMPITGYSIFVSKLNPQFADSYRFAELLGQGMLALGRSPSLHHAENIQGENRELLDTRLGIYRFDDLIVLKKTTVPAVLLEVGVIVDPKDQQYVNDKNNQKAIVGTIVSAVRKYERSRAERH